MICLGDNMSSVQPFNGDPALRSSWSSDGSYNPVVLKTARLAKFQVDFRYTHVETYYTTKYVYFCFDINNMKDYKCIRVPHSIDTPTAPAGYIAEDGGQPRTVAADATYAAGVPISPNGDPLWYRVTCNGTDVRVRVATTQAGLDTAFTSYRGSFEGKLTGGHIGFRNGQSEYIDNVTVRSDPDNDGSYNKEEMIEQFNTDPVEMRYDAAGNLTFDGNYTYKYDAWGRQVEVKRAFVTKDANGTKTYHEGSTISTSAYDGRGRRIRKQITNSGDQNYTYIYYYDGYRIIEERNGSDQTIKTYVWGQQYVDELLQINTYIGTEGSYWAMQDANYNVIGIVNETGRQVERYEYTPYGERTIYGRQTVLTDVEEATKWSNDAMLTYPQLTSARISSTIPVNLCDFGFQGKMHDAVTGLISFPFRMYSPTHQRLVQPDPWIYIDGMDYYLYARSNPLKFRDPTGLAAATEPEWKFPNGGVGDPDPYYEKKVMTELEYRAIYFYDCWKGIRTNCMDTDRSYKEMYEWYMKQYEAQKEKYDKIKGGGGGKWLSDYYGSRLTCKECDEFGKDVAQFRCETAIQTQYLNFTVEAGKNGVETGVGVAASAMGWGIIARAPGYFKLIGILLVVFGCSNTSCAGDLIGTESAIQEKAKKAITEYCNCDKIVE